MRRLQMMILMFVLAGGGILYMQSTHDLAVVQKTMKADEEFLFEEEISITSWEKETFIPEQYRGAPHLLFFFTTWCHVCGEQWEEVKETVEKAGDIRVTAVNLSESEYSADAAEKYVNGLDLSGNIHIVKDTESSLQKQFRVVGVPSSFLFDENGELIHRQEGPFSSVKILEKLNEQ